MTSPTEYYLTFKANCCNEYDVYESHRCTQTGCLWTTDEYTGNTCIPGKESEFVAEYNKNLLEGKVVGYEIEEYIEVES